MQRVRSFLIGALAVLPFLFQPAFAGVEVGDVAPPLKIKDWVRGQPVDLQKEAARKLHLVEFWATWCPPCKASVPLLTDLQKKFEKDLVVIGVTDPDPYENSPTEIKQFVKKQGAAMTYTVAMDDSGATTKAYMSAEDVMGIPHAYLVGRDGRVLWQGSPLDPSLDSVISEVIAGKYDMAAAQKAVDLQRSLQKRFEALDTAYRMGQIDVVWQGLTEILSLDPGNELGLQLLISVYSEEDGYGEKFRQWVGGQLKDHGANTVAMSTLAIALLSIENFSAKVPDLAIEAARTSYESSGKNDPFATAIFAQALYQIGALDRAIELQTAVVAKADEDSRKIAAGVLAYYQACKKLQTAVQ